MNINLAQQAVEKALLGLWDEARVINLLIISKDPSDIDALNRLSRAYFELGNINKAKITVMKVLKLDPYNTIALKSSDKWKNIKKIDKDTSQQLRPESFLEEPGRTKVVHLVHPCDKYEIAQLNCGDIVSANIKSHRISIISNNNNYIGKLPDDVSIKIRKLIKFGYKYVYAIKSINSTEIKIFIRETYRPDKYSFKPSFSADKIDYIPYTAPELIHEKGDSQSPDEDSESGSNNIQESTFDNSD